MDNNVGIKRKCGCCGKYLYVNKTNLNDVTYYDKITYHSNCFIEICQRRTGKRNASKKWQWALDHIDSVKNDTYLHFINSIYRDEIYQFIRESYNITIIPTTIWNKLSDIYTGTFKGMIQGIPPEHLLDMWRRKINFLNKNAKKKEIKGVYMRPDQRINYDLTILVNKYDSYLEWKRQQKLLEVEEQNIGEQNIVNQAVNYHKIDRGNMKDDDISALVDDIFG